MNALTKVLSREFDFDTTQITEAEKKAVLNVLIMPFVLITLTSNIMTGVAWIALLSLLYITKISHKKQNATAFFTLLSYAAAATLVVALTIIMLSV